MVLSVVRSRMVATLSTTRERGAPCATRCLIASTRVGMFIGFTRISSAWSRMAWAAAVICGKALNNLVTALGLA